MFDDQKYELAIIMRRLYKAQLTTSLGGNVSVRVPNARMLISPTATDKSLIDYNDIGEMTLDCEIIGKNFSPSIESKMHAEIYKARSEINAIIHAHPLTLSAFASTTFKISNKFTVETYAILGEIAYADYALMGSEQLAENCANSAKISNSILMRKHGAITLGKNLLEAFDRMEVFENAAKLTLISNQHFPNGQNHLTHNETLEIDNLISNPGGKL